jgi:hypothetical protein
MKARIARSQEGLEFIADEINELTKPISQYGIKFGAYESGKATYNSDTKISRDTYKKERQKQAWQRIFSDMNMDKYVTKGVKETINKFVLWSPDARCR